MHSALKERRDALQEKLKEKTEELRLLCLREGELTGELPPEYPITPGQPPPTVRKRVGTSFTLSENLINKIINKQVKVQIYFGLYYMLYFSMLVEIEDCFVDTSTRQCRFTQLVFC